MRKLTLKTLKEMLKKDYFISDYKSGVIDNKCVYITYSFSMIKLCYSDVSQWSILLYGEIMTMQAKHALQLCDKLEGFYIGEKNGL